MTATMQYEHQQQQQQGDSGIDTYNSHSLPDYTADFLTAEQQGTQCIYMSLSNTTGRATAIGIPLAEQMPLDCSELEDCLKLELAHPALWLLLARHYRQQGNSQAFLQLLTTVSGDEASQAYKSSSFTPARIAILNTLAAHYTQQALHVDTQTSTTAAAETNSKRQRQLTLAIAQLNKATELLISEPLTWINKALLQLQQYDVMGADAQANNALHYDSSSVGGKSSTASGDQSALALLCKALTLYARGEFVQSLDHAVSYLRANPAAPAATRLVLAYCYWQLHDEQQAERVFRRILQLCDEAMPREECIEAKAAIASLLLNRVNRALAKQLQSSNSSKTTELPAEITQWQDEALSLLEQCGTRSHVSSILLADHLFFAGDTAQASRLLMNQQLMRLQQQHQQQSSNANASHVSAAHESMIVAEALFQRGRLAHHAGDLMQAQQLYEQAMTHTRKAQPHAATAASTATAPTDKKDDAAAAAVAAATASIQPLLRFHLAQTLAAQHRFAESATLLESLQQQFPQNLSILRLLSLVADDKSYRVYLHRIARLQPMDAMIQLEMASQCAGDDDWSALRAAQRARQLPLPVLRTAAAQQQNGDSIKPQTLADESSLVHNVVALRTRLGLKCNAALQQRATQQSITGQYNAALQLEQQAGNDSASREQALIAYQRIVEQYPDYLDAAIRHAALQNNGQTAERLIALADRAKELHQQEALVHARTLLAHHYAQRSNAASDSSSSQTLAFAVWTQVAKLDDNYAKLACGNTLLFRQQKLQDAAKWYRSVLAKDSRSMHAAQGLACVLAMQHRTEDAKHIFMSRAMREAQHAMAQHANNNNNTVSTGTNAVSIAASCALVASCDALRNAAHCYAMQHQHSMAVKLYQQTLDKLQATNEEDAVSPASPTVAESQTSELKSENAKPTPVLSVQNRVAQVQTLVDMARAHYMSEATTSATASGGAADSNSTSSLLDAIACLEKAHTLCEEGGVPRHPLLVYNAALAREESAIRLLQRGMNERTLGEVEMAVQQLTDAKDAFLEVEQQTKQLLIAQKQQRHHGHSSSSSSKKHKSSENGKDVKSVSFDTDAKSQDSAQGDKTQDSQGDVEMKDEDGANESSEQKENLQVTDQVKTSEDTDQIKSEIVVVDSKPQQTSTNNNNNNSNSATLDTSVAADASAAPALLAIGAQFIPLLPQKSATHAAFCIESLKHAHLHLQHAQLRHAKQAQTLEQVRKAAAEIEAQRAEQARLASEAEAARREAERVEAERVAQRLEAMQEQWKKDEAAKVRRKSKRSGSIDSEDSFIEDDTGGRSKKRRGSKRTSGSGEGGGGGGGARKKKRRYQDASDGDEDGAYDPLAEIAAEVDAEFDQRANVKSEQPQDQVLDEITERREKLKQRSTKQRRSEQTSSAEASDAEAQATGDDEDQEQREQTPEDDEAAQKSGDDQDAQQNETPESEPAQTEAAEASFDAEMADADQPDESHTQASEDATQQGNKRRRRQILEEEEDEAESPAEAEAQPEAETEAAPAESQAEFQVPEPSQSESQPQEAESSAAATPAAAPEQQS